MLKKIYKYNHLHVLQTVCEGGFLTWEFTRAMSRA